MAVPQAREPPKARTAMIRNAMMAAKVRREARRRAMVALMAPVRCTAYVGANKQATIACDHSVRSTLVNKFVKTGLSRALLLRLNHTTDLAYSLSVVTPTLTCMTAACPLAPAPIIMLSAMELAWE
jgi:hypothetical protein